MHLNIDLSQLRSFVVLLLNLLSNNTEINSNMLMDGHNKYVIEANLACQQGCGAY